jgi:ABC-type amino acid transport substrate-binding protein
MVISGMSISPDRNLKVAFVGPYFVSGKSIVTKAEKADSLSSPADLAAPDVKIAALEGSTSQTLVKTVIPTAQLQTTTDYDKALALVIDYYRHVHCSRRTMRYISRTRARPHPAEEGTDRGHNRQSAAA